MYQFGKAVSGGTPLGEDDIRQMETERLRALQAQYRRPAPTSDVLDRRLSEELAYSKRLLEMAELELKRRGGSQQLTRQVAEARTVVGDVAGVVGAEDHCAGVAEATPDVQRRLRRGVTRHDEPVCRQTDDAE